MKAYEGRRSITSFIFNLYTRWRRVVYSKFRLLYPLERRAVFIEQEAG
jgi:hypothetical protein